MYYTGPKEPFTDEEAGQVLQLPAKAKPQKFMIQPCENQAAFESHITNVLFTHCLQIQLFVKHLKSYIQTLCLKQQTCSHA